MSKVFQEIDNTIVTNLLGSEVREITVPYSEENFNNSIYLVNTSKYHDILDAFEPNTDPSALKGKKVYIVPGIEYTNDRLRGTLDALDIKITGSLKRADAVVVGKTLEVTTDRWTSFSNRNVIGYLKGYYVGHGISSVDNDEFAMMVNDHDKAVLFHPNMGIRPSTYSNNCYNANTIHEKYITSGGLKIMDAINNGLGVVSAEDIINNPITKLTLDEELVETISSQIWGSDEDIEMAGKIIPNIDYETNIHYLWKLAAKIGARIYRYNRNKDVKTWIANSRFNMLYRMNSFEMIEYLQRNNKLDHASFTYLEPIYRKGILIQSEGDYTGIAPKEHPIYKFKVEIKPEYLKYMKNEESVKSTD